MGWSAEATLVDPRPRVGAVTISSVDVYDAFNRRIAHVPLTDPVVIDPEQEIDDVRVTLHVRVKSAV